jgi:hypothetical protein
VILREVAIVPYRVDVLNVWLINYDYSICIYIFTNRESWEDAYVQDNTLFLDLAMRFSWGSLHN